MTSSVNVSHNGTGDDLTTSSDAKKLKILVSSLLSHGHLNTCFAIGKRLLNEGHEVCFTVDHNWKDKVEKLGFKTLLLTDSDEAAMASKTFETQLMTISQQQYEFWDKPVLERIPLEQTIFIKLISMFKRLDNFISSLIKEYDPDVILTDNLIPVAAIYKSGKPWVRIVSANPLGLGDERLPPCFLGMSIHDDPQNWKKGYDERDKVELKVRQKLKKWFDSEGLQLEWGHFFGFVSPYLNLYTYPQQVDYFNDQLRPKNGRWLRMSHCIEPSSKNGHQQLELPAKFESLPGKLIYLSMGTIVCNNVKLMQRLIDQLKDCPHRILLSLGPAASRFQLHPNMHGASFLPQLEVLKRCDLIIGHGGNNSFMESLYYGTPQLLLPLFGDQPDNAIRVQDLKLGETLDAYCEKQDLLNAIERLLADDDLRKRLKEISRQLQGTDSIQPAADEIVQLAYEYKQNN